MDDFNTTPGPADATDAVGEEGAAPVFRSILLPPRTPEQWSATQPECWRDLNLDQVVTGICGRAPNEYLLSFYRTPFRDCGVVTYRQAVFRDLRRSTVAAVVLHFTDDIERVNRLVAYAAKLDFRCHRLMVRQEAVLLYCGALRRVRAGLSLVQPKSEGLRSLLRFLGDYQAAATFRRLEQGAPAIAGELADIRYSTLIVGKGVIVRKYGGEPDYSAKVLSLFERFSAEEPTTLDLPADLPSLNHIEAGVLDLVGRLFPSAFSKAEQFLAEAGAFIHPLVSRFEREIRFYLSYLRFIEPLADHPGGPDHAERQGHGGRPCGSTRWRSA